MAEALYLVRVVKCLSHIHPDENILKNQNCLFLHETTQFLKARADAYNCVRLPQNTLGIHANYET